jgi:hypothetical protein
VLAALYFPELKSEADRFTLSCREQRVLIGKLSSDVSDSRDDLAARQAVYQNFLSRWQGLYQEYLAAQDALTEAARRLVKTMGVDEHP